MTSLDGITLHVSDVEASRSFYERIPGTVLVGHRPDQFALFRVGEMLLGLLQLGRAGFHLEIGTDDLDEMHGRLIAAGIRPKSRTRVRPWGERTFNVVDPDGYVLEFQE